MTKLRTYSLGGIERSILTLIKDQAEAAENYQIDTLSFAKQYHPDARAVAIYKAAENRFKIFRDFCIHLCKYMEDARRDPEVLPDILLGYEADVETLRSTEYVGHLHWGSQEANIEQLPFVALSIVEQCEDYLSHIDIRHDGKTWKEANEIYDEWLSATQWIISRWDDTLGCKGIQLAFADAAISICQKAMMILSDTGLEISFPYEMTELKALRDKLEPYRFLLPDDEWPVVFNVWVIAADAGKDLAYIGDKDYVDTDLVSTLYNQTDTISKDHNGKLLTCITEALVGAFESGQPKGDTLHEIKKVAYIDNQKVISRAINNITGRKPVDVEKYAKPSSDILASDYVRSMIHYHYREIYRQALSDLENLSPELPRVKIEADVDAILEEADKAFNEKLKEAKTILNVTD